MINFFESLKELEENINIKLAKFDMNNTGFQIYIRKAFLQKKTNEYTTPSFLKNNKRKERENNVINIFD